MNTATKIGVALQVTAIASAAGCLVSGPGRALFADIAYDRYLLVDNKILGDLYKRHGKIRGVNSVSNAQNGSVRWFKGWDSAQQEMFKNLLEGAKYCYRETGPGHNNFKCYRTEDGQRLVKYILYVGPDVDEVRESPVENGEWLNNNNLITAADDLARKGFEDKIYSSFIWLSLVSPLVFSMGTLLKRSRRKSTNQKD